jgi:selenocysteine lyase/cysteine desulfurase
MEQSRRDFLKVVGKVTAGLGLTSLTGVQSPLTSPAQACTQISGSGAEYWQSVRDNYFKLSKDYIYMNNSTMGPTLVPVSDRMQEVQKIFSQGCTIEYFNDEIVMSALPQLREEMRQLVNADTYPPATLTNPFPTLTPGKCVGNVDSVTEGMSFVANGLNLASNLPSGPKDVIIYTDHEHAGGRTMWELKGDRFGAVCGIPTPDTSGNIGTMVPLITADDTEDTWAGNLVQRFIDTINYNNTTRGTVKVVSFPWITTSTGHVLPVAALCAAIKGINPNIICVIDGAQAFTIIPMDLQAVKCDFMVVNGHKYLCGPIGSGFIVARATRLGSTSSSWPTVVDDQVYKAFGNPNAHSNCHRKTGLSAYTNILPLYDALTFYESLGVQNVYNRLLQIGQWLRNGLAAFPLKFELITPMRSDLSCVMTCFRIIGIPSQTVYESLRDNYAIQVKHSTEGFPDSTNGAVRLAPHYYNTAKEFNKLQKAICEIAGMKKRDWQALWPPFPE